MTAHKVQAYTLYLVYSLSNEGFSPEINPVKKTFYLWKNIFEGCCCSHSHFIPYQVRTIPLLVIFPVEPALNFY